MKIKNSQRFFITTAEMAQRNLCPLKDYKGQILNLTNSDKKKITKINAQIVALECDVYDLSNRINKMKTGEKVDYLFQKMCNNQTKIDRLKDLINEIKAARFRKQNSDIK